MCIITSSYYIYSIWDFFLNYYCRDQLHHRSTDDTNSPTTRKKNILPIFLTVLEVMAIVNCGSCLMAYSHAWSSVPMKLSSLSLADWPEKYIGKKHFADNYHVSTNHWFKRLLQTTKLVQSSQVTHFTDGYQKMEIANSISLFQTLFSQKVKTKVFLMF